MLSILQTRLVWGMACTFPCSSLLHLLACRLMFHYPHTPGKVKANRNALVPPGIRTPYLRNISYEDFVPPKS